MRIGIIGGGSIGLLLGSYLAKSHQVTVYVKREQQKQNLNKYGIISAITNKTISVKSLLIDEMNREDYLIICVKQYHISEVVPNINKSNSETPAIFLQNGMSHISLLHKLNQPVLVGIVEHGAFRENDHIVAHTGKGIIKLAAFSISRSHLEAIADHLNQQCFPIQIYTDWKRLLHEKLVINAVINPLTTLFDIENGEILKNAYIYKLACELCREASLVLELEFNTQWERVQAVAENTGNNVSSMLKDVRTNMQTEIEAISGYIINQSNHSIPYTEFIYTSVKALEVKKGIKKGIIE